MASRLPGFEYDIFISYRHNDNRSGWVTEFVKALREELAATIKEDISVYFDSNPHDGLLETHNVDKSLEGKLKCLIFIPIISQTYCDPKSFAWQHEFVAFNKSAKEDHFGRDITVSNGNVASRILPIKIHDLDAEDKVIIENEIGGVLRAIEFVFSSPGVSRPLRANEDHPHDNATKLYYRDQINKVARGIKELVTAIQHPLPLNTASTKEVNSLMSPSKRKKISLIASGLIAIGLLSFSIFYFMGWGRKIDPVIEKSIAVLPFVNMSNDPEQEFFSDGMTDEILNRLYKLGDLKVISRTSSMKFKGVKLTAKEIAAQLGVANILEGSVQKSGTRIKITVQLIDAATDNHLWSESYEKDFTDVFAIQSEIASGIARELRLKFSPMAAQSLGDVPTQNQLAYEYRLKGNEYWQRRGDIQGAIDFATKSVEEDSLYADARYDRLNGHLFFFWIKLDDGVDHLALADKDIKFLKRRFPESRQYKGAIAMRYYWVDRNYTQALKLYAELLMDNPNNEDAILFTSSILRRQGRMQESIAGYEKSMKVDPLNDDLRHQLGMTYIAAHEYNKALEVYRLGLTLSPDQIGFRRWMTFSRIALGYNLESALKESGLTNDVWTKIVGYDFVDKSVKVLEAKRKEGKILNADQHDYRPLTLDYALTYYLQGNRDLAKRYADSTASFLLVKQNAMANNYRLFASLGKAHAISGNAKAAVQSGEKATELLPITLDAIDGPYYEQNLAEIYIIMKQYDVALDKIEKLLSIPGYFSVGWMMVNPIYEPLRDLPRFKKLVEKYKYMAKK